MKITRKWLVSQNACEGQVERFAQVFPDGADVTDENLARAKAEDLDLSWLARNPNTPAAVLEWLAGDAGAYVRNWVFAFA